MNHLSVYQLLKHYDLEPIGAPVESRKGGKEIIIACPFHSTISGNFYINDKNGMWMCRSAFCGLTGDLIRFVSLKEKCSEMVAWDYLCDLAGIEPGEVNKLSVTMSILDGIGRIDNYHKTFVPKPMELPPRYKVMAHPYFTQERGIDEKVLIEAEAGAVFKDEFYRYRACIPVKMGGEVYSLYSRACGPSNPKHHYSGDSLTSHLLYGLDEFEGDEIILVEAILSVLKLRSMGFKNVVSVFKASISQEQILKLIETQDRFKKVILCGDNDQKEDLDTGQIINPGMVATWKNYRKMKKFFDVGVARLPVNIDPADMDEPEEFEDVLDNVIWPSGKTKERKEIETFFQRN